MKITIQITVESDHGRLNVAQEVAHLDRGTLRPETLGLTLAEARSILAGIEQTVVEQQAAEFMALQRTCSHCGYERSCKGRHHIVFRTPFGKLRLESPRLYRCQCESNERTSFSPLAELLQERSSPELVYLETKFAALVSYGLTVELLKAFKKSRDEVFRLIEEIMALFLQAHDVRLLNNHRVFRPLPMCFHLLHKFRPITLCDVVTSIQLFGQSIHVNESNGVGIFLRDLTVIEDIKYLHGEPCQDRIARPVVDSGKDSGQKPRRSLQERLFHAGVIPKCCSNGSGVRLGLRE